MDKFYNINLLAQAAAQSDIIEMPASLNTDEECVEWISTMEGISILLLAKLFFVVLKKLETANGCALSKECIIRSTKGSKKTLKCVLDLVTTGVPWKEKYFGSIRMRSTTFYFVGLGLSWSAGIDQLAISKTGEYPDFFSEMPPWKTVAEKRTC